jgi:hypothetical protein
VDERPQPPFLGVVGVVEQFCAVTQDRARLLRVGDFFTSRTQALEQIKFIQQRQPGVRLARVARVITVIEDAEA